MVEYFLRLLILLPLIGGLAWGTLWIWKRTQGGMPLSGPKRDSVLGLVQVLPMGVGAKLAVVDFAGQQILLAVTRAGISRIADTRDGDFHAE